jgi:hypothetical protein
MALLIFDSGEATRYPSYTTGPGNVWAKRTNQPSRWEIYGQNGSMGVQTSTVYSGTTAFRCLSALNNRAALRRSVPGAPISESWISFMFQTDLEVAKDIFALFTDSMELSMRVSIDANMQILVYAGAGAVLKQTIPTGWGTNEWHQIRIHQKTGDHTLEIRLDENPLVDCSNTPMAAWYYLTIGNYAENPASSSSLYYDCIQVNDATGSLNNSWPGSPSIPTALRPSSDNDAVTDWIRSSGTHDFEMIDETSPDLDSTFVSSANNDDESLYGFTDLAEPANVQIVGVCLTAVAKRADAAALVPIVSRGGTTIELDALETPIGADYMTPIEWFLETDPITSDPWTQTNLNATEFGFKHVV